jgi:hypothetical protein
MNKPNYGTFLTLFLKFSIPKIIWILFLVSNISKAQDWEINGIVYCDNMRAAGITVNNINSTSKTKTDFDGVFKIKAKKGDSIFFSGEKIDFPDTSILKIISSPKPIYLNFDFENNGYRNYCNEIPDKSYIFIGEKIKIKNDDRSQTSFMYYDTVIANYKIIQLIYGDLESDTITFHARDHASIRPFEFKNFKKTLFFVEKDCDENYLVGTSYYDIYKTDNGKWALPAFKQGGRFLKCGIDSKSMNFIDASFKITTKDGKDSIPPNIEEFKIVKRNIIPITGYYVEDIISCYKQSKNWKKFFEN